MSKFHESVRVLLEDVHCFLCVTLHPELLSPSALAHKQELLLKLKNLHLEYPQLQLSLPTMEDLVDKNQMGPVPSCYSPSSPPPYVDMQGNSSSKLPSFNYDSKVEEDNYVCSSEKSSGAESQSLTEFEDNPTNEGERKYPAMAATELNSFEMYGYLEKKKRERLGGWLNSFQRRWCCIREGLLYYYDKSTDRRQKGAIALTGYEARSLSTPIRDAKKANYCFELICPGKRTYQFAATSAKDMKQWIAAVERNNKCVLLSSEKVPTAPNLDTVAENKSHSDCFPSAIETEDIYEVVEDENECHWRFDKTLESDYLQEKVIAAVKECTEANTTNQIFDYREWYVGLWDCTSSDSSELNFIRGDLIKIVSKEYDSCAWWIGELQGRVGLVPKSYLMEAYELC